MILDKEPLPRSLEEEPIAMALQPNQYTFLLNKCYRSHTALGSWTIQFWWWDYAKTCEQQQITVWCKGCIQRGETHWELKWSGYGQSGAWLWNKLFLGKAKGTGHSGGWAVVQENLNEVGKRHMSEFGEEVTNRVKLRRRLGWRHIIREGDCYKDYGKGRAWECFVPQGMNEDHSA